MRKLLFFTVLAALIFSCSKQELPKPGQYPYIHENLGNATIDTYNVPITGLEINIIAHGALIYSTFEVNFDPGEISFS